MDAEQRKECLLKSEIKNGCRERIWLVCVWKRKRKREVNDFNVLGRSALSISSMLDDIGSDRHLTEVCTKSSGRQALYVPPKTSLIGIEP